MNGGGSAAADTLVVSSAPSDRAVTGGIADQKAAVWISSPGYDILLLLAGPLLGLITMMGALTLAQGALLITALAYLVGVPHYLSTFVFFLGDSDRSNYLAKPMAYLGVPLIIVGFVALCRLSEGLFVVLGVIFVWNVWHVSMQSAGIVSIYRHLNRGARDDRRLTHLLILTANAGMAFWWADHFAPLSTLTAAIHPHSLRILSAVLLLSSTVLLVVLARRIRSRRTGISWPELMAISCGILLFHPMLWVDDLETATFGMLIGHFVQYLALVWLIQNRKFARTTEGSRGQRALGMMSRSPAAILVTIATTGVAVFLLARVTDAAGQGVVVLILLNALALVHFYLDGLIWAFRNPRVRESIGPYLMDSGRRSA